MCAFCDHRNPPGAKFCNDCASPLHLKPCKDCDAVNDHAWAYCHHCGGAFPMPVATQSPMSIGSPAETAPPDAVTTAHSSSASVPIDGAPLAAGTRPPRPAHWFAAGVAA